MWRVGPSCGPPTTQKNTSSRQTFDGQGSFKRLYTCYWKNLYSQSYENTENEVLSGLAAIAIGGLIFWNNSGQDETVYRPGRKSRKSKTKQKVLPHGCMHSCESRQPAKSILGMSWRRAHRSSKSAVVTKHLPQSAVAGDGAYEHRWPNANLFIDPDNPSTIFTGSVSGGLFRSTTAGVPGSWSMATRPIKPSRASPRPSMATTMYVLVKVFTMVPLVEAEAVCWAVVFSEHGWWKYIQRAAGYCSNCQFTLG